MTPLEVVRKPLEVVVTATDLLVTPLEIGVKPVEVVVTARQLVLKPVEVLLTRVEVLLTRVEIVLKPQGSHEGARQRGKGPSTSGKPVTLASNQQQPDGIAVDSSSVYWTQGGVTTNDGTLLKLTPK